MTMEISATALHAFSTRQQATAHNIANVNTDGFDPQRVDLEERQNGGVEAQLHQPSEPFPAEAAMFPHQQDMEPQPSATDLAQEMVDMITTENAYTANAKMLSSQASMHGKFINEIA